MKKHQKTSIQDRNHPNKVCPACGERLPHNVEKLPCGLHTCGQPRNCLRALLFERDTYFCPVCTEELPKDAYGHLITPEPNSMSRSEWQLNEATGGLPAESPPNYNLVFGYDTSGSKPCLTMEKHGSVHVKETQINKGCYHRETSSLICMSFHVEKGRQLTVLKLKNHRLWVAKTVVWDKLRNACPTEAKTHLCDIALNKNGFYVRVTNNKINSVEVLDLDGDFSFKKLRTVETSQVPQDFVWVLLAMNNTLVILIIKNLGDYKLWKKVLLYHNEQLVAFIDLDIRLNQTIFHNSYLLCFDRYLLLKFNKNVIAVVDLNANKKTLTRYVELEGSSIEDVGEMSWVNLSQSSGILFISTNNKPVTTIAYSLDLDRVHNGQKYDRLLCDFLERMGVNKLKVSGTVNNQSLICHEHPFTWQEAKYTITSLKFQK